MNLSKVWLNGNQLAQQCLKSIKLTIDKERQTNQQFYRLNPQFAHPQIDIVNIGFNAASLSYIKKKITLAKSLGINFQLHQYVESRERGQHDLDKFKKVMNKILPEHFQLKYFRQDHGQECFKQLSSLIHSLNKKAQVSGILLQLPLLPYLYDHSKQLTNMITPMKDVDCLTVQNRAKVIQHQSPQLMPCTPAGVLKILDEHNIDVSGKTVIMVGRSSLVGLPLFHLLLNRNATITLCHSKTQKLNQVTSKADIVISAVGKPNLITNIKPGAIAIDIGISRDDNGKLCGDICETAKRSALLGTPVPGGVGPLTVAMLMQNTVNLWKHQMHIIRKNSGQGLEQPPFQEKFSS